MIQSILTYISYYTIYIDICIYIYMHINIYIYICMYIHIFCIPPTPIHITLTITKAHLSQKRYTRSLLHAEEMNWHVSFCIFPNEWISVGTIKKDTRQYISSACKRNLVYRLWERCVFVMNRPLCCVGGVIWYVRKYRLYHVRSVLLYVSYITEDHHF
jgi:hypothetical protein